MKVILTLSQIKMILKTENLKYPIKFKGTNFTKNELKELSELLTSKSRG
ncbi:MAG: hypothetical protein J7574_09490 [Flavobacterium sp.]|nr:hypothetical protein [Flavobacterium sp.]MBO9584378.1 hypothetical protein [Flavobacterium sp.]